jgi:hypothetical protein
MAELARKHAQQGTFQEGDKEFLGLYKEYVSSVSPDREGILNRAMNEIIERTKQEEDYTMSDVYQQVKSQIAAEKEEEKEEEEKELIDYFIELLKSKGNGKSSNGTISDIKKNGDYYEVNIDHGGGKTTTLGYANGELINMSISGNNYFALLDNSGNTVKYGTIKDDNGNMIAAFGGSQGENDFRFHSCPTNAEIERQKEVLAAYNAGYNFATGNNSALHPGFSESYKEIYNSTYDRLTNNIVA